jgi:hypothetical protein
MRDVVRAGFARAKAEALASAERLAEARFGQAIAKAEEAARTCVEAVEAVRGAMAALPKASYERLLGAVTDARATAIRALSDAHRDGRDAGLPDRSRDAPEHDD